MAIARCSNVIIANVRISGGSANRGSGIAIADSDSVTITNSDISNNGIAASGGVVGPFGGLMGGGVYVSNCSTTLISGSVMKQNSLQSTAYNVSSRLIRGGGLFWLGLRVGNSVAIRNCVMSENTIVVNSTKNLGEMYGGGLFVHTTVIGSIKLMNVTASWNTIRAVGTLNSASVSN